MSGDRAALERADHARLLREDGLLEALLHEIEDETVARWAAAVAAGEREDCWQLMQAMIRLRNKLEAAIGGGALARARQGGKR